MREVIWKWDVLDSSNDYPVPNSKDFISDYPSIWQKLSNIENIINLINYANEWCNLHNDSLYSIWIHAEIICIHQAVSEELRGNEIRHRFYPETIRSYANNSYANERGDMKIRWLRFIKVLPSTQQWRFHPKLPCHLAEIIKYWKYH
jgi:hypothetical protein